MAKLAGQDDDSSSMANHHADEKLGASETTMTDGPASAFPLGSDTETYADIMAKNPPNPRGPGYLKLYVLAGSVFLCSTMNGEDPSSSSDLSSYAHS